MPAVSHRTDACRYWAKCNNSDGPGSERNIITAVIHSSFLLSCNRFSSILLVLKKSNKVVDIVTTCETTVLGRFTMLVPLLGKVLTSM